MVKPLTARSHPDRLLDWVEFAVLDFLGQQTEEDGCHLSAGDVAVLRSNVAVRVADDVRIVVIAVQTGRYIIRNVNGRFAAAATTAGLICGSIRRSA